MSTTTALVLSLAVAWLIIAACSRPSRKLFSAWLVKGKDGRVGISLTPVRKKKTKRRRSR